jgi:hypothetical protein
VPERKVTADILKFGFRGIAPDLIHFIQSSKTKIFYLKL